MDDPGDVKSSSPMPCCCSVRDPKPVESVPVGEFPRCVVRTAATTKMTWFSGSLPLSVSSRCLRRLGSVFLAPALVPTPRDDLAE